MSILKKSLYLQKTTKTEAIENGNATDSFKYEPIEHMIVTIGETESGGMYICIDPSDGDYKTVSSFSLLGDSYKINYLKRY